MGAAEWFFLALILGNIMQWLNYKSTKDDYKILLEMSDRIAKMWKDSYEFERKLNYDIVSGKEYAIYKGPYYTANETFPESLTYCYTAAETAPIFPELDSAVGD